MTAKYLARLEEAAEALQILTLHPDGLGIDDLAQVLGLDEFDTRQNLAAFHESQFLEDEFGSAVSPLLLADTRAPQDWGGRSRSAWFEEHEAPDLESAVWVALDRDLSANDTFGVMLDVPQIVDILNCAEHLLAQEPDNEALRTAMAALQVKWVPDMTLAGQEFGGGGALPPIRRAIVERRRLRFRYSREWEPGTSVRTVEPYELKKTHLGYEVDAGPVADNGRIRTYLVRNMSEIEVLDDHFEEPPNKRALIERNRETITVPIVIPKGERPAYEFLALDLDVLEDDVDDPDGERMVAVTLQQPFDERLALFMFRAGPDAFVAYDIALMNRDDFERYDSAAPTLARSLLAHHALD